MSQLAVYDKGQGRADKKIDRLFRRDFIYRQNMWSRFYAAFVVGIGLICIWVYRFFTTDMDLFDLDLEPMMMEAVLALGVALLIVTVIGTIKGTADYQSAQGRLRRYYKLLAHLDRISANEESREQKNGAGASSKRGAR
jgi:hypothetical protein